MFSKTLHILMGVALLTLVAPFTQADHAAFAGTHEMDHSKMHEASAAAPMMTKMEKIEFAMKAGPKDIAEHAAVVDLTGKDMKPRELRAGTNGWVCYIMPGESMCADKQWQTFVEALGSKKKPNITGTGISYMLAGGAGGSNIDPFAEGPTADNQWMGDAGPHIMVIYANPKELDVYTTDWKQGGPWAMWKGTPYAHLMVPLGSMKSAPMMSK